MRDEEKRISDLERLFYGESHRICQKWQHYFRIYERHLERFRGKRLTLVEIGVSQGGSLQIWKKYFGTRARIIGIDINPLSLQFADEQTEIIIGDQGCPEFMNEVLSYIERPDLIIDDGSHIMSHQTLAFDVLYPAIAVNGVYLCEDVHTSYHASHGGGLRRSDTFVEFMKNKIDDLHSWYVDGATDTSFARETSSISFYDSIIVVEKGLNSGPVYVEVGQSR